MAGHVYSFLDVKAGIVGPGGAFSLGSGAGAAEEGITIQYLDPVNNMQIGADGRGQHSLSANKSAQITVRVLKTSPVNQLLATMLAFQRASPSAHGQNTILITDVGRGDVHTATQCAFSKWPDLNYQKNAGLNEWVFDCISVDTVLGG